MVDITDIFPVSEGLGYLSLLIVSFLGSAIVFVPAPVFVVIAAMGVQQHFDPLLVVLISAVGAAGGKLIIFYGSYYGRKILPDETKRRMLPLQKLVSRYGWIAAFIAAATPVPDDLVYIPLGLSKYNPLKFIAATFSGKIILSATIVLIARTFGKEFIQPYLEGVPDLTTFYIYMIIFAAVLTVIIIYILKIDWSKNIGKWFPWTVQENEDNPNGKH